MLIKVNKSVKIKNVKLQNSDDLNIICATTQIKYNENVFIIEIENLALFTLSIQLIKNLIIVD